MANFQALLPEELTVKQVALILDMSEYAVQRHIEKGGIESEDMHMIPTKSVGDFLMNDRNWMQESSEMHIYNTINE